ncbi:MAG: TonB-dependent receptor [Candidatus Brocadia sp.]|nr:TonB-dependent receptor [Candidatus Brocadia sp.]UJS18666.1 MAG: TonB-dependent receptor [Candidatus Jettenia sp.]
MGIEEQYTSRRKTISDNFADSFFITNATLYGRNIWKTLEVSGSVYNLLDKRYDHPASEEHLVDTIQQDGRIFRIKLTYSF